MGSWTASPLGARTRGQAGEEEDHLKSLIPLALLLGPGLPAQDESVELRLKLAKGDSLLLKVIQSVHVKMDQIPESFQGVLSEDPLKVNFQGTLGLVVREVSPSGIAKLEGEWRSMRAQGTVTGQPLDYTFDADPKPKEKGPSEGNKKGDSGESPQGLLDLETRFREASAQKLALWVDRLGLFLKESGEKKGMGEMFGMFLSLNGLMGGLPLEKVRTGDTWKGEVKLGMPSPLDAVEIRVRSENTLGGSEEVQGLLCRAISSRFSVGGPPLKDDAGANPLGLKVKMAGEGEGKASFAVQAGYPARSQSRLKVKLDVTIANPGGNDEITLKATLTVAQEFQLRK